MNAPLVVPLPDLGVLAVSGPDRSAWLHAVVTCDVRGLQPGQGTYGLLLERGGHIVTDLNLVATPDQLLVSTAAGRVQPVLMALDRLLVMEDAELADRSAELGWIVVVGEAKLEGVPVLGAAPVTWPGCSGQALVVARSDLAATAARLGTVLTPAEWHASRVAFGFPWFGVDYDERDTPHEAALERACISWTKGCYVGQDVVARQEASGPPPRRLVRLALPAAASPPAGTPVLAAGEPVGEVTSSGGGAALGRVRSSHATPGTVLVVGGAPAVVG